MARPLTVAALDARQLETGVKAVGQGLSLLMHQPLDELARLRVRLDGGEYTGLDLTGDILRMAADLHQALINHLADRP